jgi:hypothetical protein
LSSNVFSRISSPLAPGQRKVGCPCTDRQSFGDGRRLHRGGAPVQVRDVVERRGGAAGVLSTFPSYFLDHPVKHGQRLPDRRLVDVLFQVMETLPEVFQAPGRGSAARAVIEF